MSALQTGRIAPAGPFSLFAKWGIRYRADVSFSIESMDQNVGMAWSPETAQPPLS